MVAKTTITVYVSAKPEETKHRDNDDHETDDVDNVVHAKPPCNGMMPIRHG